MASTRSWAERSHRSHSCSAPRHHNGSQGSAKGGMLASTRSTTSRQRGVSRRCQAHTCPRRRFWAFCGAAANAASTSSRRRCTASHTNPAVGCGSLDARSASTSLDTLSVRPAKYKSRQSWKRGSVQVPSSRAAACPESKATRKVNSTNMLQLRGGLRSLHSRHFPDGPPEGSWRGIVFEHPGFWRGDRQGHGGAGYPSAIGSSRSSKRPRS